MRKDKGERHRYGRHYTPDHVARLLAAFAVRSPSDLVLDPSCGDGRLLAETLKLKVALKANQADGKAANGQSMPSSDLAAPSRELFGIDRDAAAVQLAAATGANVACADFFDLSPGQRFNENAVIPAELDAIIGNPPYIRQEVMGASDKQRIALRLARPPDSMGRGVTGKAGTAGIYWPRWSGRSDIYIYFFAHSASFLRSGGRLVFITASSWLDVGYGVPLQQFFLNNFRIVAVIESAVESFFEDASVNTAITVLEREPNATARDENHVRFVQLLEPLADVCTDTAEFASFIEQSDHVVKPGKLRIRTVRQEKMLPGLEPALSEPGLFTDSERSRIGPTGEFDTLARGSKWGRYLRADDVFFNVIERGEGRLKRVSEFASVRFGVKTGANEFFYVTADPENSVPLVDALPEPYPETGSAPGTHESPSDSSGPEMVPLQKVASVRRGLTTGANEFFYVKAVNESKGDEEKECPLQSEGHLKENFGGDNRKNYGSDKLRLIGRRNDKLKLVGQVIVEDGTGTRRLIESRFLSPVIFSLKEIPGIIIGEGQTSRLFFNCSAPPGELEGSNALNYIHAGERAGYNIRPSCASRNPWYGIARDRRPAPIIFPSKVGERWVVALNEARVFEDKKLYGIYPSQNIPARTLAALLNSTWARYYAEMTCRQMTGAQAIADIDVVVAEQILLPDPRKLLISHIERLESALGELARRPVLSVFEEVNRPDRRRLDDLVLEIIGFPEKQERDAVLNQLYDAVLELVRRRLARSRKASQA
ncbi:MAG TPA: N-6 DNA methylase [Blastocatellia bacterium]|nr:N-6 DNA methylase [Blastocatellia bacterium]